MASATPDLRLPSQPQGIVDLASHWPRITDLWAQSLEEGYEHPLMLSCRARLTLPLPYHVWPLLGTPHLCNAYNDCGVVTPEGKGNIFNVAMPTFMFFSRRIGWYQIILLGDRGTYVLTACPGLHSTAERLGFEPTTY